MTVRSVGEVALRDQQDLADVRLLFVCTGNICRSPSAEYLLRADLTDKLGNNSRRIGIRSAGLDTPGGWELDPKVAELLKGQRIEGVEEFRSQPVNRQLLSNADLIL